MAIGVQHSAKGSVEGIARRFWISPALLRKTTFGSFGVADDNSRRLVCCAKERTGNAATIPKSTVDMARRRQECWSPLPATSLVFPALARTCDSKGDVIPPGSPITWREGTLYLDHLLIFLCSGGTYMDLWPLVVQEDFCVQHQSH